MLSLLSRLILLAILLTVSFSARAERTDVVYLKNGDRITGEVKSLYQAKLEFKTDHMGTLYIEWDDIREIVSDTGQAVELSNGQRFHGPLTKAENQDMLMVETEEGAVGLSTSDVVGMYQVNAGFWNRLDLSARLGFSWDKGSEVGRYNVGLDAEYRHPNFITRGKFSTEVTTQEGRADTNRGNLNVNHLVFKTNKKFIDYFGDLEQNDELGLDLRALVGAAYGWMPVRSNRNWFSLAAGLDVNREIPVNGNAENNLEAVGMMAYEYYKYSTPQRKLSVTLLVFPSLTDFGRVRARFNTDFRIEFFTDLFWVLDFFANYDTDPISINASNSDYGIVSSLAYKF
jgi:hypothetical protein